MLESMGLNDGQFLIRQHQDPGVYALAVTYKGKPTHHKVSKVDGVFAINNKKYGQFATLDELVGGLSAASPPQGWPVRLIVASGGGGGRETKSPRFGGGAPKPESPWLYGQLSRDDAEAMMRDRGMQLGDFIIREGQPGVNALCVVYKGRATHHKLAKNADGMYEVNGKCYGNTSSLKALVALLSSDPPPAGWPVRLVRSD